MKSNRFTERTILNKVFDSVLNVLRIIYDVFDKYLAGSLTIGEGDIISISSGDEVSVTDVDVSGFLDVYGVMRVYGVLTVGGGGSVEVGEGGVIELER